jgi:ribosome-associated protein
MTERRAKTTPRTTKKTVQSPGASTTRAARSPVTRVTRGAARSAAHKPAAAARKAATRTLRDVVVDALEELKAINIRALDVRGLTDITDTMVVASGTSDRHVRSIADRVVQRCKEAGYKAYGIEGERDGEWLLVDLHDVVLHVMLPRVREFYALEKLWAASEAAA